MDIVYDGNFAKVYQHATKELKVRKSRNDFFEPTFPPKMNKGILLYYYETSGWLDFVRFLEEIEDNKDISKLTDL